MTIHPRPEATILTRDPRNGVPVRLAFHRVDRAQPQALVVLAERGCVVEG